MLSAPIQAPVAWPLPGARLLRDFDRESQRADLEDNPAVHPGLMACAALIQYPWVHNTCVLQMGHWHGANLSMLPALRSAASCLVLLVIGTAQHRPLHTAASAGAWRPARVQQRPSLDRPFIFIHQRKTGGTSIRHAAQAGAECLLINDTAFIPCEQKVACATFAPPPAQQRFSIYAGHLNFYTTPAASLDKDGFACLTSFRHPLDRAISCLYFRFPDRMRGLQLQQMSPEEFRGLLHNTYHENNASCNNEAITMLSRVADARQLEALMRDRAAVSKVVREAIANVEKCVVLMHGRSDGGSLLDAGTDLGAWNARTLTHFFPWLPEVGRKMVNPHPRQLPAHLVHIVYELNWPELLVYRAALRQYLAQQIVLGSASALPRATQ